MHSTKKIFLQIFILLLSGNLTAQTIISPSIGLDYSTLNNPDRELIDHYGATNRQKYTLSYNLNFEKFLAPKLSLSFNGNLTQKKIWKTGVGPIIFNPSTGLDFYFFKGSVLIKYYPKPYLYVGIGPNKNYTFRPTFYWLYSEKRKGKVSSDSFGVGLLAGIIYKKFFTEFSYNYGFEEERQLSRLFIANKISSSAATIGYRFDISKKKRRKKK